MNKQLILVSAGAALALTFGSSLAQTTDPALEALKRSQFCASAAKEFMSRPEWKAENQIADTTGYTSHYNNALKKCLVQVRANHLLSKEKKQMEMIHVYDALEGTNLGGKVVTKTLTTAEPKTTHIVTIKDAKFVRDPTEAAVVLKWLERLMID